MIAIQASSDMRKRISQRVWRGIHVSSYGVVWLAAVHAGLAGTDTVNRLCQALALLLTMVAVAATVIRILAPGRVRPAPS